MKKRLSPAWIKQKCIKVAMMKISFFGASLLLLALAGCGGNSSTNAPSGNVQHQLLPEQYIWVGPVSPGTADPRFFRKSFVLSAAPDQATLYVAGPYNFDVFINGTKVSHVLVGGPVLVHDRPVVAVNVASNLHAGLNALAILASGSDVMAAKIVPAAQGVNAASLILSDATWKAASTAPSGWEQPGFDDTNWAGPQSLGSIELAHQHFRGNFDLGMYLWPGYEGLNAVLSHASLDPMSVTAAGAGSVMIDFGHEISGRLQVVSSSQKPVDLLLNFGESEQEATPPASFLSTRDLVVPASATAYGPMTAFRFVLVTFADGPEVQPLVAFHADDVVRHLPQRGSFVSSDEVLNKTWQTSVYTTELGMQDIFWDAPKRDRNPFSGDIFVAGRTAQVAFGSQKIIPETLSELLRRVCNVVVADVICKDINGIPSYNAWWVLDLGDWYGFSGDLSYVQANHDTLIGLLNTMSDETTQNLFDPSKAGGAVFADWSPGMVQFGSVKAPDAVEITTFTYYMAFKEGAFLLRQLGDSTAASEWEQKAANVRAAAIAAYWDGAAFGPRMQTNAMAVFSGVAGDSMTASIFSHVLSQPPTAPVTPYFNYFVISAMAQAGHREEALALIRQQWGSMLQAGATAFWEVYDPACPTTPNFHACLTDFMNSVDNQGTNRLFVSLAHAWSSGPAPWLHQEILGIRSLDHGFKTVQIRPDLAGLQWARGTESTPNGDISINIQSAGTLVDLDIPPGMDAYVSILTPMHNSVVAVNGRRMMGSPAENGNRHLVHVGQGHFTLRSCSGDRSLDSKNAIQCVE